MLDNGWVTKHYKSPSGSVTIDEAIKNEFEALTMFMNCPHFQQVIDVNYETKTLTTQYCGEPLGPHTSVKDEERQVERILNTLNKKGVTHRDVRPGNIMVKDGIMTLIDFEWAVWRGSPIEHHKAPESLGMKWRQARDKFNDEHSLKLSLEMRS